MKRLAVIRIRGRSKTDRKVESTLQMLRLSRVNYCVLLDDNEVYRGMLKKVKDYITWGEVDAKDITSLLKNRGELTGGIRLTDSYVRNQTKFKSISDFSKAFLKFEAELETIPGLRRFFRMHPPRRGHEGMKKTFKEGGALGCRSDIKGLLHKMR
ncbi:MAG: 50S ribosomal protein L30 [Candidatus Hydrothermarchaeales archaeon]